MNSKFEVSHTIQSKIGIILVICIFLLPGLIFPQQLTYYNQSHKIHSWSDTSKLDYSETKIIAPFSHHYASGFKRIFTTKKNLLYLGTGVVASLLVRPYDDEISNNLKETKFKKYDIIHKLNVGGFVTVISAPVFTYIVGRAIKKPYLANTGIYLLEAIATTQVLTYVSKQLVQRTRPNSENKLSYPSGHTSGIFTIASVLEVRYGYKVGIPFYIIASAVGLSRVIQHKHFPTDVIAGATLGIIFGRSFAYSDGEKKTLQLYQLLIQITKVSASKKYFNFQWRTLFILFLFLCHSHMF